MVKQKKPAAKSVAKSTGPVVDQDLVAYIKAGYPLLYMVTPEENRADLIITRVAQECKREIVVWSATEGFVYLTGGKTEACPDPIKALTKIKEGSTNTIYVLRDLHAFFKSPHVVRHLRDIARDFKQACKVCIITSPVRTLPPELERDAVMIDLDLPDREQITEIWSLLCVQNANLLESLGVKVTSDGDAVKIGIEEDEQDRIVTAAMGLTSGEAENAFAKATVQWGRAQISGDEDSPCISKRVMQEKAAAVKKSGVLEYSEASENPADIGGLDVLKLWLDKRSRAFSKAARAYGLPMPKGILLVGLPGCGKSLTAKAASNILNVPLIRFDISRVFGGIVGQSEQQMRGALQTIDRVGQCVVWIDEAEKAFAGAGGSGSHDSGVTKRIFGSFLTYMQEKKGAGFVVMTVNNIDAIVDSSPEMLRKGRFDEIFFVGLPSDAERTEIFRIHIVKNGRDPSGFNLKQLSKASVGFSGAEIEQCVIEGLYSAFYDGEASLATKHVLEAIRTTNPLSKSSATALDHMKAWAEDNAVNASLNGKDQGHAGRKLDV